MVPGSPPARQALKRAARAARMTLEVQQTAGRRDASALGRLGRARVRHARAGLRARGPARGTRGPHRRRGTEVAGPLRRLGAARVPAPHARGRRRGQFPGAAAGPAAPARRDPQGERRGGGTAGRASHGSTGRAARAPAGAHRARRVRPARQLPGELDVPRAHHLERAGERHAPEAAAADLDRAPCLRHRHHGAAHRRPHRLSHQRHHRLHERAPAARLGGGHLRRGPGDHRGAARAGRTAHLDHRRRPLRQRLCRRARLHEAQRGGRRAASPPGSIPTRCWSCRACWRW